MLRTKLSKETEVTQAAGESTDELLAEIRDILKSKN